MPTLSVNPAAEILSRSALSRSPPAVPFSASRAAAALHSSRNGSVISAQGSQDWHSIHSRYGQEAEHQSAAALVEEEIQTLGGQPDPCAAQGSFSWLPHCTFSFKTNKTQSKIFMRLLWNFKSCPLQTNYRLLYILQHCKTVMRCSCCVIYLQVYLDGTVHINENWVSCTTHCKYAAPNFLQTPQSNTVNIKSTTITIKVQHCSTAIDVK